MEEANIGSRELSLIKTHSSGLPKSLLLEAPSVQQALLPSCSYLSALALALPSAGNAFPLDLHMACSIKVFKLLFKYLLIREIFHVRPM